MGWSTFQLRQCMFVSKRKNNKVETIITFFFCPSQANWICSASQIEVFVLNSNQQAHYILQTILEKVSLNYNTDTLLVHFKDIYLTVVDFMVNYVAKIEPFIFSFAKQNRCFKAFNANSYKACPRGSSRKVPKANTALTHLTFSDVFDL